MKIHSFNVQPNLPENIKFLEELANDMWFTWNWQAILLFVKVDAELWTTSKRNPKWFLGCVPQERFEQLSKDENFVNDLNNLRAGADSFQRSNMRASGCIRPIPDLIIKVRPKHVEVTSQR